MSIYIKKYTILLLFLVAVATYLNTITHGFVYDDTYFSNRRDLYSFSAIPRSFVQSYILNNRGAGFYRPLAISTFAFTFTLFGHTSIPFHLTNILLHAIVTVLVFYFSRLLKLSYSVAFITALLFAVHPVHVDAVASIKGRDEVFYGLFFLIGWGAFIKSSYEKKYFFMYATIVFFSYLLALLSKEMAITIPIVSLLSLGFVRMSLKKVAAFMVIWGVASVVYAILRYVALEENFFGSYGTIFPGYALYVSSWVTKVFTSIQIYYIYLKTLLFPLHLSATYGYAHVLPIHNPTISWIWIPGLVGGLVTTVCLFISVIRKQKLTAVLIASWIVLYFPVSQLFGVKGDVAAERWMYTPSIIFILLVSLSMTKVIKNKKYLTCIVSIIAMLLFTRTIIQNRAWATNFTIFSNMVQSAPKSVHAQTALGLEYFVKRDITLAKKHAAIAESIYPEYVQLQNLLGNIASVEKKYEIAQKHFDKSLALQPDFLQTFMFLGSMNFSKEDFEKAKYYYEFVLQKKNSFSYEDIIAYAATLSKLKKYQESLSVLSRLNPQELDKNQTKFLLAVNYYKLGDKQKVLENIRWNNALSRDEREKILIEY